MPALLAIYALANVGVVIGYLPLLALLLPIKVEALAGGGRLGVLAVCVIAGAVAAAGSNVLFGWLSDRSYAQGNGRRRWLAGGTVGVAGTYALLASAPTAASIVGAVILFQIAINAMLAPVNALMAEEVPDEHKGIAAGLLALGVPVASGLSVLLIDGTSDERMRFGIIVVAVAIALLPLVLMRPASVDVLAANTAPAPLIRRDLAIAWAARLTMLVGNNAVSLYLLYYVESIVPGPAAGLPALVARLLLVAAVISVPVAVAAGRLSDRIARRKPFLLAMAVLAAAGLAVMAGARDWSVGAAGFGLYTIGSASFIALHTGFSMQLLPSARHRGRDLGLLNLANTLPSLIGPALTYWLATPQDFAPLMLALATMTLVSGVLMLAIRSHR